MTIGNATLMLGDARNILPSLEMVDCVLTDPPYFRVKGDEWDNEWDKPAQFLDWMRGMVGLLADRMKPNASLYLFASPQMAGRVETVVWERLNVLGNIVWRKGRAGMRTDTIANRVDQEAQRAWFAVSERIIFAEHPNAALRQYLCEALSASGWTPKSLNAAMGFAPRGMAESRYFGLSEWQMPTAEHYATMQRLMGKEHLWRDYDDIRRPFTLTARDQWSDVWDFDPVAWYPGKHPCEKPVPLITHMLRASTRPGAVVLDAFMGSGAVGDAAIQLGRRFIGIERDPEHFASACRRIGQAQEQAGLFARHEPQKAHEQMRLEAA